MPQIPQFTQQIAPTSAPDAQLSVQSNPQDFGAGLAEGANQVTSVIGQQLKQHKENADSLAVMAADKKLADWENKAIYDSQTGALAVKGKDALALPDTVLPQMQSTVSQIANSLTDDTQKQAFARLANARQEDVYKIVHRHVAQEYTAYDQQETSAYVTNSQNQAAANANDPVRVGQEINRQQNAIQAFGIRNGIAPDQIALEKQKAASDTQIGVLDQLLSSGQYQKAQDYYTQNKDQIIPTAQPAVEKAIQAGSVRGQSQQQADSLVAKFSKESDALNAARQIQDPLLRDATVQRVQQRFQEQEQLQQQNLKDIIDKASLMITNGGTVDQISPQDWEQIPRPQRAALRALQNRGEWYQDDKKWYAFTQLDPKQLAGMNLYTQVRPYVDDAHWDRALQMQKDAQAAQNGDASKMTAALTFQKRLDNQLVSAGVFKTTSGLTGDDAALYANVETEAAHELQMKEQALGRKATGDEMQQVIDNTVLHIVKLNQWGTDPQQLTMKVKQNEQGEAYVPIARVPDAAAARIRHYGESLGYNVSDSTIEKVYAASLMGADDKRIQQLLSGQ